MDKKHENTDDESNYAVGKKLLSLPFLARKISKVKEISQSFNRIFQIHLKFAHLRVVRTLSRIMHII